MPTHLRICGAPTPGYCGGAAGDTSKSWTSRTPGYVRCGKLSLRGRPEGYALALALRAWGYT